MEGKLSTKTLPEELVERIVAMVPFPAILQARYLSRAWRARFSSASELDDEEEKRLAILFQEQVRSRAKNWGTFFPVRIGKELCSAFDWGSRNWVPLPSLSFLPKDVSDRSELGCQGANSGLLVISPSGAKPERSYVANIFTRSWKLLPSYPAYCAFHGVWFAPKLFMDSPSGPYKVIGISPDLHDRNLPWSLIIYESKTDAWRIIKVVDVNLSQFISPLMRSVCLNGVLYMVPPQSLHHLAPNVAHLLALNVEEGTCENLTFVSNGGVDTTEGPSASLLVWGTQLVMIKPHFSSSVSVLKVNLVSRELLEMSRGPPDSLSGDFKRGSPSCHGNYLFFRGTDRGRVAYNMLENEWSLFQVPPLPRYSRFENNVEYTPSSFQPGLDLFWTV